MPYSIKLSMQSTADQTSLPVALQWRMDRLNRTRKALFDELARYEHEALNRVPAPGQWSAIQVIHHLLLAEEQSLGYLRKKLSQPSVIPRTSLLSRWRTFLLWFYLATPLKFKAPASVGDEVLPESSSLLEVEERWQLLRQNMTTFLGSLPADLLLKEVYKHPFAGRLPLTSMLDFFYWHFVRHYQQIMRTLAA